MYYTSKRMMQAYLRKCLHSTASDINGGFPHSLEPHQSCLHRVMVVHYFVEALPPTTKTLVLFETRSLEQSLTCLPPTLYLPRTNQTIIVGWEQEADLGTDEGWKVECISK